jgi:hypothetical protein
MALAALLLVGGCAMVLGPWEPFLSAGLICCGLGMGVFFDARFNLLNP